MESRHGHVHWVAWLGSALATPSICALFELGEAYDRAGQTDSTLAIYERYISTPSLFRLSEDAVQLPIIYRRLGELYEERGDDERAADYYSRFVDLWKDADPELQPVVADARARVAQLVGER